MLAVASADGRVLLMDFVNQGSGRAAVPADPHRTAAVPSTQDNRSSCSVGREDANLRELSATAIDTGHAMVLSLDWCQGPENDPHRAALVASTSSGVVAALQVAMCAPVYASCKHVNELQRS